MDRATRAVIPFLTMIKTSLNIGLPQMVPASRLRVGDTFSKGAANHQEHIYQVLALYGTEGQKCLFGRREEAGPDPLRVCVCINSGNLSFIPDYSQVFMVDVEFDHARHQPNVVDKVAELERDLRYRRSVVSPRGERVDNQ